MKENGSSVGAISLKVSRHFGKDETTLFSIPTSLVTTPDGWTFVSDNKQQEIYSISPENLVKQLTVGKNSRELRYPNTIQLSSDELLVSDRDGIKFFGLDGSFHRLIRTYFTDFHFTVDTDGNIYSNPIFASPKNTDPLIMKFDKQGRLLEKFGERANRFNSKDIENHAFLAESNGLLAVAFQNLPLVQIYDVHTHELVQEINIRHPTFARMGQIIEEQHFVRPGPNTFRLLKYIGGVKFIGNKIYVLINLPSPEIVEFDKNGTELHRYCVKAIQEAQNYFGLDIRQNRKENFFVVGLFRQESPIFVELKFAWK